MRYCITRRTTSLLLALLMLAAAAIFSPPINAAGEAKTVTIRVEGEDMTLIPKTEITVSNFDLTTYGEFTNRDNVSVIHVLIRMLEEYLGDTLDPTDKDLLDVADNVDTGGFINSLLYCPTIGDRSWQYTVNNNYALVGLCGYEVADGDDIVLYYMDWHGVYSHFDREELIVEAGMPVRFNLAYIGWSDSGPAQGATLLTSKDGALSADTETQAMTDVDGSAILTFDTPGTYLVSAKRKLGGVIDISRPYCKVTVTEPELMPKLRETESYILRTVTDPTLSQAKGDWAVLGIARALGEDDEAHRTFYNTYYKNVVNILASGDGVLQGNNTEYSRPSLALSAIGKDLREIGGYDITLNFSDFNTVKSQGINGVIYALLALDTYGYEIPLSESAAVQNTREQMLTYIIEKECNKGTDSAGGFALFGTSPDPDITGMALQALAPYRSRPDVAPVVDRAVNTLSTLQSDTGTFTSWGSENLEAVAQVVTALSVLGIDCKTDARFIKNGNTILDAMFANYVEGGGFLRPGKDTVDAMTTEQCMYAMVAYMRMAGNHNSLYDMTDVPGEISVTDGLSVSRPVLVQNSVNLSVCVQSPSQPWVLLAAYKDGKLVGNRVTELSLSAGDNTYTLDYTPFAAMDCDTVYLYMWDSLETARPLTLRARVK